jgi:hypothetical protein
MPSTREDRGIVVLCQAGDGAKGFRDVQMCPFLSGTTQRFADGQETAESDVVIALGLVGAAWCFLGPAATKTGLDQESGGCACVGVVVAVLPVEPSADAQGVNPSDKPRTAMSARARALL